MKKIQIIKKANKKYPNFFTDYEMLEWIFEIECVINDIRENVEPPHIEQNWFLKLGLGKQKKQDRNKNVARYHLGFFKDILINMIISQICYHYVCLKINLFLRNIIEYDRNTKKINSLMELLEGFAYVYGQVNRHNNSKYGNS